uniref:Ig-like domain-containing protein n=1 Tax=Pelusios castaneus TaxID=367368 RepID=A0A8C8STB6_9SAUR
DSTPLPHDRARVCIMACLLTAETHYPKPSIWLSPSREVGRGGAVTIHCRAAHHNVSFLLYKAGNPNMLQGAEPAWDMAEFPLRNVSQRDGGSYSCQYGTKANPPVWSELSDPVELTVVDIGYSKPNISLWPSRKVAPGGAVTIRCQCQQWGMRILLYKLGDPEVRRWAEPAGNLAEFPIRNASRQDAGSYSCRYSTKSNQPFWSEPSDPVELVVAGEGPGSVLPFTPFALGPGCSAPFLPHPSRCSFLIPQREPTQLRPSSQIPPRWRQREKVRGRNGTIIPPSDQRSSLRCPQAIWALQTEL